jgi:hypothetical protein
MPDNDNYTHILDLFTDGRILKRQADPGITRTLARNLPPLAVLRPMAGAAEFTEPVDAVQTVKRDVVPLSPTRADRIYAERATACDVLNFLF